MKLNKNVWEKLKKIVIENKKSREICKKVERML